MEQTGDIQKEEEEGRQNREGGLRGANSYKISKSWGCNTQHREYSPK